MSDAAARPFLWFLATPMAQYVIRRLLLGVLTLLLVTALLYTLIRLMPGSPFTLEVALTADHPINQDDIDRMRKEFGLDQPIYLAYFQWLGNLLQGNMGISLTSSHRPVAALIGEALGNTLFLAGTSLFLVYALSIPLGLYFTVRAGSAEERVGSLLLYMLYSLPAFVAALFLQIYLAVWLEWFPLRGMMSDNYATLSFFGKVADRMWHAFLPILCFTYGSLAYYSRFIRATMQEVIRQDYIRTAEAKGVGPVMVVAKHGLRNVLIPLLTLVGLSLPTLFSGSVVLEGIFGWRGMGGLMLDSLQRRDYPTIMGLTLMFSVATLVGQLLADILYALADPRVRVQ